MQTHVGEVLEAALVVHGLRVRAGSCCVHRYDQKLRDLRKGRSLPPAKTPPPRPPLPTQQFGVSLQ